MPQSYEANIFPDTETKRLIICQSEVIQLISEKAINLKLHLTSSKQFIKQSRDFTEISRESKHLSRLKKKKKNHLDAFWHLFKAEVESSPHKLSAPEIYYTHNMASNRDTLQKHYRSLYLTVPPQAADRCMQF